MSNNPDNAARLRSLVDRIVRLSEEKAGLTADIREIYAEAKSAGHSPKALRLVVKRAMEDADARAKREADEAEAELMEAALGEFRTSPLGVAAMQRVGR